MRLFYQVLHAGVLPPRMTAPWYATIRELMWERRKGDAWIDKAEDGYWVIWRGYGESLNNEELEWRQINVADLEILRLEEAMKDPSARVRQMLSDRLAEGLKGSIGDVKVEAVSTVVHETLSVLFSAVSEDDDKDQV